MDLERRPQVVAVRVADGTRGVYHLLRGARYINPSAVRPGAAVPADAVEDEGRVVE